MLRGIGTSGGIGIGHVLLIKNVIDIRPVSNDKPESGGEVDAAVEREHFDKSRQQFIDDTNEMIDGLKTKLNGNDKTALILKNQIYLASDEELVNGIYDCIDNNNMTAVDAVKQVCSMYAGMFAAMDSEVMKQRVADICNEVTDGDDIIVDGEYGEVFVKPLDKTIAIYKKKKKRYDERIEELKQYIGKDTRTKDDERFCLAANIGNDKDCAKAMDLGAEGVGLFRTEFFFLEGSSMPTEEIQFEAYKRAAVLAKGRFVTIRTLDIGGDKDIPYMGLVKESNPFLGYRAIRYCLGRTDVFITQLRAIIRASAYGNIRIMIPLVTNIDEVVSTRKIISDICKDFDTKEIPYDKNIQVGVMIETPAAALIADILAANVDFFSIGTNDLTQYTMAVDRGNENVAYLYSVYNPAVLRSIRHIISCARQAGIEVGMCGEAAANPGMIPLLISFGLDEFSVSPSRILETRKNIAGWTRKEADSVAFNVMRFESEKEVVNYLNDYIAAKSEKERNDNANISIS